MDRELFKKSARDFLDEHEDILLQGARARNGENPLPLRDYEKDAVEKALDAIYREGDNFAGMTIGSKNDSIAVNLVREEPNQELTAQTLWLNPHEGKDGQVKFSMSAKEIREGVDVKKPERKANELFNEFMEKYRENMRAIENQGLDLTANAIHAVNPMDPIATTIKQSENIVAAGMAIKDMISEKVEEKNASIVKDLEEKVQDRAINIREHLGNEEIAILDNMPEKERSLVEDMLGKVLHKADKDDMFLLSISDERDGKFAVFVSPEKDPANQIAGFVIENGEIERGSGFSNSHWKEDLAKVERINSETVDHAVDFSKQFDKNMDAEGFKRDMKETFEKPLEEKTPDGDTRILTNEEIDNPEKYDNYLEGLKTQMDRVLEDAVVNGADKEKADNIKNMFDKMMGEAQSVNEQGIKTDMIFKRTEEKAPEEVKKDVGKTREFLQDTTRELKKFKANVMTELKEDVALMVARGTANRDTRVTLHEEIGRQRERKGLAADYGTKQVELQRVKRDEAKLREKLTKKAVRKTNSIFNVKNKVYSADEVMSDRAKETLASYQKTIKSLESDMKGIKKEFNNSINESINKIAEIQRTREDVGLGDRGLDKKLGKALEKANGDMIR